jgi:hypothetical protein
MHSLSSRPCICPRPRHSYLIALTTTLSTSKMTTNTFTTRLMNTMTALSTPCFTRRRMPRLHRRLCPQCPMATSAATARRTAPSLAPPPLSSLSRRTRRPLLTFAPSTPTSLAPRTSRSCPPLPHLKDAHRRSTTSSTTSMTFARALTRPTTQMNRSPRLQPCPTPPSTPDATKPLLGSPRRPEWPLTRTPAMNVSRASRGCYKSTPQSSASIWTTRRPATTSIAGQPVTPTIGMAVGATRRNGEEVRAEWPR